MKEFKTVPIKPVIPFDVFSQIDIRIGTIETVEEIAKSDKLLLISDFRSWIAD